MEGFGDHVTEFMANAIEKEHAYQTSPMIQRMY